MLEYTKSLLEKVSFDRTLFIKELQKSLRWLSTDELPKLKAWVWDSYWHVYPKELAEIIPATH